MSSQSEANSATSNASSPTHSKPPSSYRSMSIELLNSTGMGDLTVGKTYKREASHRFMVNLIIKFLDILVS